MNELNPLVSAFADWSNDSTLVMEDLDCTMSVTTYLGPIRYGRAAFERLRKELKKREIRHTEKWEYTNVLCPVWDVKLTLESREFLFKLY